MQGHPLSRQSCCYYPCLSSRLHSPGGNEWPCLSLSPRPGHMLEIGDSQMLRSVSFLISAIAFAVWLLTSYSDPWELISLECTIPWLLQPEYPRSPGCSVCCRDWLKSHLLPAALAPFLASTPACASWKGPCVPWLYLCTRSQSLPEMCYLYSQLFNICCLSVNTSPDTILCETLLDLI